jgi:hypothetical protein
MAIVWTGEPFPTEFSMSYESRMLEQFGIAKIFFINDDL